MKIDKLSLQIGVLLRKKRMEAGYSQDRLGKALNITFQQIQKYENGKNRLSTNSLYIISKILRFDIGNFIKQLDKETPLEKIALENKELVKRRRLFRYTNKLDKKYINAITLLLKELTNNKGTK